MKTKYHLNMLLLIITGIVSFGFMSYNSNTSTTTTMIKAKKQDSVLRHIVLFKFKKETTQEDLKTIEETFAQLPTKIPEIIDFEWGTNNSPEGLDKGFTHSFFVSFKSEEGRAIYLPHPDHKAFVAIASPYIEDVLVVDYWTK